MEILRLKTAPPGEALCALQQSRGYARALRRMGADVETLIARDAGGDLAHLNLVRRKLGPLRLFWVPRGPIWHPATTADQRAQVIARLPATQDQRGLWILSPDTPEGAEEFRHAVLVTPQYVAEIDLTRDEPTRLAAQHGKWRNRLHHALNSDLRVTHRPFDPHRDQVLLAREMAQQRRNRYRALPTAFVLAWAQVAPRDTRLFSVSQGEKLLAQMLILLHKPAATYHIGWSGAAGRRASAHNLAIWEMANWLAARGYQRLDLGHVDTENTPGLARFKIGSGATVRPLGPTCLLRPALRLARPPRRRPPENPACSALPLAFLRPPV